MRNKFFVLFMPFMFLLILASYHTAHAAQSGYIHVKLIRHIGNVKKLSFVVHGQYSVSGTTLAAGTYTLEDSNGKLVISQNGSKIVASSSPLSIIPGSESNDYFVSFGNYDYLGEIQFTMDSSGYVRPTDILPIEDYLKGVVPTEMPAYWPSEALKAQAIAARTFVARYGGATINDTTQYQAFNGYVWRNNPSTYANSNKAVEETQGEVAEYNGSLIYAGFSASNGGMILSNTNSWGTTGYPYLQTKKDPYDPVDSPFINWTFSINQTQIDMSGKDLSKPGQWWNSVQEKDSYFLNNYKSWLKVSGQIGSKYSMKIIGISNMNFTSTGNFSSSDELKGYITVHYYLKNTTDNSYRMNSNGQIQEYTHTFVDNAYHLRGLIGSSKMKSPYIWKVDNSNGQFIMHGSGDGHGIGMSQYGAEAMAKQNHTYEQILDFYYPGTNLVVDSSLVPNSSGVKVLNVTAYKPSPQKAGSQNTITAYATGGTERLYQFWVQKDKGSWKMVQDYSTSDTYSWTPTNAGDYKFAVHVKDKSSTKAYDDYGSLSYKVLPGPVKVESVTTNLKSPQSAYSGIKVTANASGGTQLLYQFWAGKNGNWHMLRDYGTSNTFTWIPKQAGDYKIVVHVKDKNSTKDFDAYGSKAYMVVQPAQITGFKADKVAPQAAGTQIQLTASGSGGTERLYQFWIQKGSGSWKMVQDYSTLNAYTWTPTEAGDYKIVVHVKDKNSTRGYDDYKSLYYKVNPAAVTVNSVKAGKPSPQIAGTKIQITADATGGTERLYQFWIQKGSGSWKKVQDYSTTDTYAWTPTQPGDYKFAVHVKDKNSTKEYDDYGTLSYKVKPAPVKIESISTNLKSPQSAYAGIKITANATGGTERLYQFWVGKDGNWRMLRNYGTSNTYTWVPKWAGDYKITVHVKDKNSSKQYDDYGSLAYTIIQPAQITGFKADKASPQSAGTKIQLTASGKGGTNRLYQFWIQKDKGSWKKVQDYSTSDSYAWTPAQPGDYKFAVHVKDKNSTKEYDDYSVLSYKVKPAPVKLESVTTALKSPQSAYSGIKIIANASGGTQLLYQFWAGKNGNWHMLKDYGTSNSYKWVPKQAGNYKIVVHVKDKNSTKAFDVYGSKGYTVVQPAQITGFKADKVAPQAAGTQIQLTASGSGGTERLYQFWVQKGSGSWKMVQNYSTSNAYTWTPTEAGDYKIVVHIKDKNSVRKYDDYKSLYYTIN